MKFKYPKSIVVGSTTFKIKYNKKHSGASLSYPEQGDPAYIEFGMLNHKIDPLNFLNLVLHELKEIIQIEQSTRTWNRGTDAYEFHYNHAAHSDLCCRLAGLASKFIK